MVRLVEKVKTPMWVTGTKRSVSCASASMKGRPSVAGFSLLELIVALAIAAILVGLAAPMAARLNDTMKYRSAVGDLVSGLAAARFSAIQQGQPVDMELEPEARRFRVGRHNWKALPGSLTLSMVAARELSEDSRLGVIRFYPDGSASGGSIEVIRASGGGVMLEVDWLLGDVKQQPLGGLP